MQPDFPVAAIKTGADRDMFLCCNVGERYQVQDVPRLHKPQLGKEVREPYPGFPNEVIVRRLPWPEKQARATEIADALEGYEAATATARDPSGLAVAEAKLQAVRAQLRAIEDRLLNMPARTPAGLLVKARVVEWYYAGEIEIDPDDPVGERFSTMLAIDLLRNAGAVMRQNGGSESAGC
jgi:hypothetical protein